MNRKPFLSEEYKEYIQLLIIVCTGVISFLLLMELMFDNDFMLFAMKITFAAGVAILAGMSMGRFIEWKNGE